jgi:hypothetical protein
MNGQVPEEGRSPPDVREAAATIDGWLRAMAPHLRGALVLRYARRAWSQALRREFGVLAGLVVRLDCALHPSAGKESPEQVEASAVARIEAEIEACRPRRDAVATAARSGAVVTKREACLGRRYRRASLYVKKALEQYAFVRGARPCVLPRSVDWDRDEP